MSQPFTATKISVEMSRTTPQFGQDASFVVSSRSKGRTMSKTRAAVVLQRLIRTYILRKRITFFVKLESVERMTEDIRSLYIGYSVLLLYGIMGAFFILWLVYDNFQSEMNITRQFVNKYLDSLIVPSTSFLCSEAINQLVSAGDMFCYNLTVYPWWGESLSRWTNPCTQTDNYRDDAIRRSGDLTLADVQSREDVQNWIETFIPALTHGTEAYGQLPERDARNRVGIWNKVYGGVLMTINRFQLGECPNNPLSKLYQTCLNRSNMTSEPLAHGKTLPVVPDIAISCAPFLSNENGNYQILFPGLLPFKDAYDFVYVQLAWIKKYFVIDASTTNVQLQFLLYNGHGPIFTAVSVNFLFDDWGNVIVKRDITAIPVRSAQRPGNPFFYFVQAAVSVGLIGKILKIMRLAVLWYRQRDALSELLKMEEEAAASEREISIFSVDSASEIKTETPSSPFEFGASVMAARVSDAIHTSFTKRKHELETSYLRTKKKYKEIYDLTFTKWELIDYAAIVLLIIAFYWEYWIAEKISNFKFFEMETDVTVENLVEMLVKVRSLIIETTQFVFDLGYFSLRLYQIQVVLLVLGTLRLLRLVQFQVRLAIVMSTLTNAASDLFHFGVIYGTFLMLFGLAAYLLFGSTIQAFGSWSSATMTLFQWNLGAFDTTDLFYYFPVWGVIFFCVFIPLMFLVLLNMLVAIILYGYDATREMTDTMCPTTSINFQLFQLYTHQRDHVIDTAKHIIFKVPKKTATLRFYRKAMKKIRHQEKASLVSLMRLHGLLFRQGLPLEACECLCKKAVQYITYENFRKYYRENKGRNAPNLTPSQLNSRYQLRKSGVESAGKGQGSLASSSLPLGFSLSDLATLLRQRDLPPAAAPVAFSPIISPTDKTFAHNCTRPEECCQRRRIYSFDFSENLSEVERRRRVVHCDPSGCCCDRDLAVDFTRGPTFVKDPTRDEIIPRDKPPTDEASPPDFSSTASDVTFQTMPRDPEYLKQLDRGSEYPMLPVPESAELRSSFRAISLPAPVQLDAEPLWVDFPFKANSLPI